MDCNDFIGCHRVSRFGARARGLLHKRDDPAARRRDMQQYRLPRLWRGTRPRSSVVAARRLAANKLLAAVGRHIPTAVWTQPPSPVEFPSARRAAAPALTKLLNGRCREPVGSASISDQCHAPCPDLPKVL